MKQIFTLFILLFAGITTAVAGERNTNWAAPSNPATNMGFNSIDGDRMYIQWTNGNGSKRIVVARKASPVTALPVSGTDYNASAGFGNGNEIATGEFVVYNGNGNGFTMINLTANTTYYLAVYEYNGTGTTTEYNMTALTGNRATLTAPSFQPVNLTINNINGHSMTLNWQPDLITGSGRIVLARAGAPVNVNPVDLTNYSANVNFGAGSQIGSGNFVIYKGNGTTVNMDDLEPNSSYHFAIFEYNGTQGLVFNTNNPPRISASTLPRPNIPSTALNFLSIEGNRFGISMTRGNGAKRIIIAKQGGPVTFVPQDGIVYTGNTTFGSGQQVAPGEYVLSAGLNNSYNVLGLAIGSNYHIAVYEYDGDGATAAYLTSASLTGSQSTVAAPTTAASNISITNVLSNTATIQWTNGDGARRLVIVKRNNPVSMLPLNLQLYSGSSSFGSGTTFDGGYSVFSNTGNSVNITGLTAGANYHVTIFEYNGTNYPVYFTPNAPTAAFSTTIAPTQAATFLQYSNMEGNRFAVNWTNGNGTRRLVIARAGAPVTYVPVDNTTYTASPIFGSGQQVAPGEYVVFNNGVGNSITFSNLVPGTTYHFAVYEYNFISPNSYFLTNPYLAGSKTALSAPTTNSSALTYSNVTGNSIKLSWVNGNGAQRLVLAKKGSPVDASPADFTGYSATSIFGTGVQIGSGNYVVANQNGNNATITGLEPGSTYHFKIIEYNGGTYPVYLNSGNLIGSQLTAERPYVAATAMNYTEVEGNKIRVRWTNGNGYKRILVGKQGSAITGLPVDGVTYTSNTAFGSGQQIAPGEFVLSDNSFAETIVTNLLPNTVYHFAVFEYDGLSSQKYMTASFLSGSQSTAITPTLQANNVLFSAIGSNTVNVNWASGNGARRVVVARKGAPVSVIPQDLQFLTANASFGTAITLMAPEHYVVYNNTGSNTPISNLASGTTYHFAVFECNGFFGPVYNQQLLATGSVTTLGAPTDPATTVVFTPVINNATVKIQWSNGSGQKRLVLMKEDAAVNAAPVNNTNYTGNSFFAGGDQLGSGNYVVYGGTGDNVTVTNLTPGKVYHVAIYEYNSFASGSLYLLSNPATGIWAGGPLPVTLTSFSARINGTKNILSWQTASEVNSASFLVERSTNGTDYISIGNIAAAGNSNSTRNYTVADENPVSKSFYRLRMIDLDGKSNLSNVVVLERKATTGIQVYPTAASSYVNLSVSAAKDQSSEISILDANGRLLIKKKTALLKGTNTIRFNVDGLAAGNYYIQAMVDEASQVAKFIKL